METGVGADTGTDTGMEREWRGGIREESSGIHHIMI